MCPVAREISPGNKRLTPTFRFSEVYREINVANIALQILPTLAKLYNNIKPVGKYSSQDLRNTQKLKY